jgi:hypothetical protein
MDYINTSVALETVVRTLESDVMSRVEDRYARSQLWATTGILANIAAELREAAHPAPSAGTPALPAELGAAAEELLERVRGDVSRQVSLHYKKAASGA